MIATSQSYLKTAKSFTGSLVGGAAARVFWHEDTADHSLARRATVDTEDFPLRYWQGQLLEQVPVKHSEADCLDLIHLGHRLMATAWP